MFPILKRSGELAAEISSASSVGCVVRVMLVPLEHTREVLAPLMSVLHLLEHFFSVNLYMHKLLHRLICVFILCGSDRSRSADTTDQ